MSRIDAWKLIDDARAAAGDDDEVFLEKLSERIAPLAEKQLLSVAEFIEDRVEEANAWDLWGAAYVLNGGCSDDGFLYFRRWLVAQGRHRYEAAVKQPESIADWASADSPHELEELTFVVADAYAAASGKNLFDVMGARDQSAEPVGTPFDEASVVMRYPRLRRVAEG